MVRSTIHQALWRGIREINHRSELIPEAEITELFRFVLQDIQSESLSHDELQEIQTLVERIYFTKIRALRTITFEFIEEVITQLGAAERDEDIARNGPMFRAFYSMYFKMIFVDITGYGTLEEAVGHAAQYLEPTNPFSSHALEAFELSWFSLYRVNVWVKDNVMIMLCIASAKVRHQSPDEGALIGLNTFLERVCSMSDRSCGIVESLCDVLANTYYMLKIDGNTALYRHLNKTVLFRKIFSHVNDTTQRNCWLAVSKFIRVLFSCDDYNSFRILSREKGIDAMAKMFRPIGAGGGTPIAEELLQAVHAACSHFGVDPQFGSVWGKWLIPYVIRYAGGAKRTLRPKACEAYEAFAWAAEPSVLIEKPLQALMALLSSKEPPVRCYALKCVFELIEKIEAQPSPRPQTMKTEILESGVLKPLQDLASSPDRTLPRRAARIILSRLNPEGENTPPDEARRNRERDFMLNIHRPV